MAYATYEDVQARMNRTMSESEEAVCSTLLDDAAIIIDMFNANASADVKLVVSSRMFIRALGDRESACVPVRATQGSMSGLGYSQSWTVSNGSVGEIYISKLEKQLLGRGTSIGSYSPVEERLYKEETNEGHDNSISC